MTRERKSAMPRSKGWVGLRPKKGVACVLGESKTSGEQGIYRKNNSRVRVCEPELYISEFRNCRLVKNKKPKKNKKCRFAS